MGTYYFFQASRMTDFNEEGVHDRIVIGVKENDEYFDILSITWEKRHGIPLESPVVAFLANKWRFLEHLDRIGFVDVFVSDPSGYAALKALKPALVSNFLEGGVKLGNSVPFEPFEDRSDLKAE